jgi:uncharacterized delta-60 repeat protein
VTCTSSGSFLLQVAGTTDDQGTALALLPTGEIISGGNFQWTNTSIYGSSFSSSGWSDIYIAKLTSTGQLAYYPPAPFALKAWGTSSDIGYSTAIDSSGNILVTGTFQGTSIDIFGQSLTSSGSEDIFLAKLSSTGNLLWARKAWGTSSDYGLSTAIDSSGNILVTGYFFGTNTDIFGQSLTSSGMQDIFLAKLSSTGNLLWARKAWGTSSDSSSSTATDSSGNVFVTGYFFGTNTDIFGQSLTSSGSYDIFLAKLSSTGNLLWAQKAWGSSNDYGYSTAIDSSGNILVTGTFQGTSIDIFGQSLTSSGSEDIFLAKLSSTGNLLWARKAWGTSWDYGYSTATDSSSNILVTGYFQGTNTDIFGQSLTSSGSYDIFLAKLSSTGNLLWAQKAWGSSNDYGSSTAIDSSGNILVTGYFQGTNTDIFGQSLTSSGSYDIFLAKLSSTGNLLWARKAWGTSTDYGSSTAIDSSGNILVTGYFPGTNTDIFGQSLTSSGSEDIFLAKFDPNGNLLTLPPVPLIQKTGGTGTDVLRDIDTTFSGNILLGGAFEGTNTDIFSRILTSSWGQDGYIAYLDSSGTLLSPPYTSKKAWGTSTDYGSSTAIDSSGNILVTGYFFGTNTDIFGQSLTSSGMQDIFLAKLSSTGNLLWAQKAWGSSNDYGYSTAIDSSGNILVTGYFQGTSIDIFGQSLTSSGSEDIFLAKLSSTGNLLWARKAWGTSTDIGFSTSTDPSGNILVTGYFNGTNTDLFGQNLSSSGSSDIFLAKLSSTGNLMWARKAWGTSTDIGYSTAIDSSGNILVTGTFQGTSIDIFGQSLTSSGSYDIFLAKLSSTGNLLWARKAWGTSTDIGSSTATDSSGNILVTGYFAGTNTDIFGQSLTSSGSADIFLAKLSSTGNLLWARKAWGTSSDIGLSTSTDSSGNILVTGYFPGTNTDIFGQSLTSSGSEDIFLAKLSSTGNLLWVQKAWGTSTDIGLSTAIDSSGNILVTGYFEGTNTDIFGQSLTSSGSYDIFLAKLDPDGNPDPYFTTPSPMVHKMGGAGEDSVEEVEIDNDGNLIIGWYFEGTDTDIFWVPLTSSGFSDIFLAKLSSTGWFLYRTFPYALSVWGISNDIASTITIDWSGSIFVSGNFMGTGTDIFGTSFTSSWAQDIFISKLSSTGNLIWARKTGGTAIDTTYSTVTDSLWNIIVTGIFQGTNTSIFGQSFTSSGLSDVYIAKLSSTGNLLWARKAWGSNGDYGYTAATDSLWNVIVTGYFESTGIIDVFGTPLTSWGNSDIFLAKLSSTGNVMWAKLAWGTSDDFGFSATTDFSGNVLVSGSFQGTSTNIFGTPLSSSGFSDIFLAKLTSTGNLIWARKTWGSQPDFSYTTIVDSLWNILVSWTFAGTNTDIFGTPLSSSGGSDIFLAKLTSTGNLIWARKAWGTSTDFWYTAAPDISWNILVTGYFNGTGTDIFGTSLTSSWSQDIFLAKLSSTGNLMWAKKAWGISNDLGQAANFDSLWNILVTWAYQWSSIDIFGTSLSSSGTYDGFLVKLDSDGNLLTLPAQPQIQKAWGNGADTLTDLETNASWNTLVAGTYEWLNTNIFGTSLMSFWSSDGFIAYLDSNWSIISPPYRPKKAWGSLFDSGNFTTTDSFWNILVIGVFQGTGTDIFGTSFTSSGSSDIFLSKLSSTGNLMWTLKAWGTSADYGYSTATDPSWDIFVNWYFQGTGTDIFGTSLTSSWAQDIYLTKLSSTGNLMWTLKAWGTSADATLSIDTDLSWDILVTGYFQGTGTDIFGTSLTSSWAQDIFLAKLSSTGNLMWIRKAWGTGIDSGYSTATDPSWDILVTGYFQGTGTDIFGTSLTSSWAQDIFLAKLSSTGNLMWIRKAWGTTADFTYYTTTDPSGNVLITGYFQGTGTDIFGTSFTSSWSRDIFLAKLSSTGNLMWARKAWGTSSDYGTATATDSLWNILVTWIFAGTNTNIFGTSLTSSWAQDIFLAKLSSTGNLIWIRKAWGTTNYYTQSANFDSLWNTLSTGYFNDTNVNIFGQILTSSGSQDIFLAKLDPDGNPDPYFTTPSPMVYKMGGTGEDSVTSGEILSDGSLVVGWNFEGSNTDIFGTPYTSSGASDIFLSKRSVVGSVLWTIKWWGAWIDTLTDIVLNDDGYLLVSGSFSGSNVNIFGTNLTSSGGTDAFVAKIDTDGAPIWVKRGGGTGDDSIEALLPWTLSIFTTGYFSLTGSDLYGQSFT